MKFKKEYIIILLAVICNIAFGQEITSYELSRLPYMCISIDFEDNTYVIFNSYDFSVESDVLAAKKEMRPLSVNVDRMYRYDISEGKILVNDSIIICTEDFTKKKIIFRKIDEYRITADDNNSIFYNNDTLYVAGITTKEESRTISWKDGRRYEICREYSNVGIQFTVYENDTIIKSYFKTFDEIEIENALK